MFFLIELAFVLVFATLLLKAICETIYGLTLAFFGCIAYLIFYGIERLQRVVRWIAWDRKRTRIY